MGARIPHPPAVFHVNWFRQDDKGKFLWPGYGENLRVLEWILRRTRGEVPAVQTPIGYMPNENALDLTGLPIAESALDELYSLNQQEWLAEADGIETFFKELGPRVPDEMYDELKRLRFRLRRNCGIQGSFKAAW